VVVNAGGAEEGEIAPVESSSWLRLRVLIRGLRGRWSLVVVGALEWSGVAAWSVECLLV